MPGLLLIMASIFASSSSLVGLLAFGSDRERFDLPSAFIPSSECDGSVRVIGPGTRMARLGTYAEMSGRSCCGSHSRQTRQSGRSRDRSSRDTAPPAASGDHGALS